MKKFFLALTCAALALLYVADPASAATRKLRPQIKNHPDIYSTHPNLPADVPYTNKRNRDWLGGYPGGTNGDEACVNNNSTCISSDQHQRRKWRRRHSQN